MTVTITVPEEYLPSSAKGLVFDLDGTVLDTMPHHWQAWEALSKEYGFSITVQQLLQFAGKPSTEIMDRICQEQGLPDIDIAAAVKRKTELYCELAGETKIIKVVMEIANAGKARGLPCAIATGGNRAQVEASLKASGLQEFFDAVVTCNDVRHGKPHPETFLKAAEKIGVPAELCVGYEDACLGMEAIKRAGFLKAVDVTVMPGYPKLVS